MTLIINLVIATGLLFAYQNCAKIQTVSLEDAQASSFNPCTNPSDCDTPEVIPLEPLSCSLNGQTISSGTSIETFLSPSVVYGQACKSQSRLCTNGVLDGSANYLYSQCSVGSASNCTLDGKTIPHGSRVTAYPSASVAFAQTCQAQSRLCTNGVLDGSANYLFTSCSAQSPNGCMLNGRSVASGSSIPAFSSAAVAYGQTCQVQSRLCSNGTLSGNPSYQFAVCNVGAPSNCSFNGQTVVHGASIPAYPSATVAFGQKCMSQARTCTNGILGGSANYTFPSCSVSPPTDRVASISVMSDKAYSPFKLLIVVDNSYTMSQSQAKLSANIDSLLAPLAGKSVDVRVITTSESIQTSEVIQEAISGKFVSSMSNPNLEYITTYTTSPPLAQGESIFESDTSSTIAYKIGRIKERILRVGTSGSDAEKFLCPVARELSDTTSGAFFKKGDKASVLLITDEDDSSNLENCISKNDKYHFSTEKPQLVGRYKKYLIIGKGTNVNYSVVEKFKQDGVNVEKTITLPLRIPKNMIDASNMAKGAIACPSTILDYMKPRIARISSILNVNCEVIESPFGADIYDQDYVAYNRSTYGNLNVDYCNLANKFNLGIKLSANRFSVSLLDSNFYSPVSCSVGAIQTTLLTEKRTRLLTNSSQQPLLPSSPSIDVQVMNKSQELFGSNFFYALIANNKLGNCPLAAGQSNGLLYDSLMTNYPGKVSTYPVCANSYASAMTNLSNFIYDKIISDYSLSALSPGFVIKKIELVRSGVSTTLTTQQYSVTGTKLQMKYSVLGGDQIKITYTAP